jgi:DNA-binding transcriptional MerR regulator
LDKAPDAFRTISEVAQDLDIPQHVLRFWETRFAQIKPMKRSGGRRYYRPDDVDLLRGIRRLLYGEGYTIRGVQRILKEHGVKAVQAIADQNAAVSFGAVEEAIGQALGESDDTEFAVAERSDREEEDDDSGEEIGIDYRFVDPSEDDTLVPFARGRAAPAQRPAKGLGASERERLERVLQDLVACRELLDTSSKESGGV